MARRKVVISQSQPKRKSKPTDYADLPEKPKRSLREVIDEPPPAKRRGCFTPIRLAIGVVAVVFCASLLPRSEQQRTPLPTPLPSTPATELNAAVKPTVAAEIAAVATDATPSATATVTSTDVPTLTQTVAMSSGRATAEALVTQLAQTPTVTITPTQTLPPTRAMVVTAVPATTFYVIADANVRTCPSTECDTVGQLQDGSTATVTGVVYGEAVRGNNRWYETTFNGVVSYVHSSLVSASPPTLVQQAAPPPVSAPVVEQPLPPAPVVVPPPQPPVSSGGFVCDCSKTCPNILTCEEAYFQLNQCGCTERDSDNPPDGVPCERLCPGG